MQLKKGDIVEVTIFDLAFGGVGVGKMPLGADENFVVFVEGAVPRDTVNAALTKIKKQYGEARLVSIVKPAENRITPRCKHFGVCGGCALQFLAYEDQLQWKEKMARDVLEKIGGFRDFPMAPIIGCASPWYYRNKMEYSFAGNGVLGLHEKKSFRNIFELEECFLESPRSVAIARRVSAWARESGAGKIEGLLRNLIVREGKNTGECMVNLVVSGSNFPYEKEFIEFITREFPEITSLYRTSVIVQRGFKTVVAEHHLAGKTTLTEKLTVPAEGKNETLTFEILPQAFFQPNTKQTEILYSKIIEFALPHVNTTRVAQSDMAKTESLVLDLFCGTGTIGMFFAAAGAHVLGIDLNVSAIENARKNAEQNNIKNIEFLCADINKEQPSAPFFDKKPSLPLALITDPPRAGIAEKALEKIIGFRIPKWIYVSCNPATLARDLKIICASDYQITKIQPVDMFPQTTHVETICALDLSGKNKI